MYASTTPLRYGGPDPVVQSTKHRYNQDRTMPSPVFFDKTTYCPVLPEENGQSMHSSPERSVRREYDLSPTQTSYHDQYARGMGMSRQQADISLSQADLSATNYTTLPKSSTLDSAESQRDQAGQVSRHRDTSQSGTFGPSTPLKQSVPNHSSDEDHSSPTLKETCLRAKEIARLERETERIIGEERVRQLTRSQTPSYQTQTARIDGQKSIFKKIAFLSRTIPERLAENLPRSSASAPSRLRAFSGSASCPDRLNGSFEAAPPLYGIMRTERMYVTVKCSTSVLQVPVTAGTRPIDIAQAVSRALPKNVRPAACTVVEHIEARGLERQIRSFESIGHILTSWGHENNFLSVSPARSAEYGDDSSFAPSKDIDASPIGFTFQLYHYTEHGKWAKRWITLTECGLLFTTNRLESLPINQGASPLSNLADADIYVPTPEAKNFLKPPSKMCYAIQNEQRSSMPPRDQVPVQFFAADDDQSANRFHELVREWRGQFIIKAQIKNAPDSYNIRANSIGEVTSREVESLGEVIYPHTNTHIHPSLLSLRMSVLNISNMKPLVDMEEIDRSMEKISRTFKDGLTSKMAMTPVDHGAVIASTSTSTVGVRSPESSVPVDPARQESNQSPITKPSSVQPEAPAEHSAQCQQKYQKPRPQYRPTPQPNSQGSHQQQARQQGPTRSRNPNSQPYHASRQCIRPSPSQYALPTGPPRPVPKRHPAPPSQDRDRPSCGNSARPPNAFTTTPRSFPGLRPMRPGPPPRHPAPPVPPAPPHIRETAAHHNNRKYY